MKKLLSVILATVMLVGMLSFSVVAEDADMSLKFNDILVKNGGGDQGMANYIGTGVSPEGYTIVMDFIYGRSGVCNHPVDPTMKHTSKFVLMMGETEGTYKYVGYSATEDAFFIGTCLNSPMYGEGSDGIEYLALSEKGLVLPGVEYKVAYEFVYDTGLNIYLDGVLILSFDLYEDMDYPTYFRHSSFMMYPTHMTCFIDDLALYPAGTYNAELNQATGTPASFTTFDGDAEMVEKDILDGEGNPTGDKETIVETPDWQIVKPAYTLVDASKDVYAQPQYVADEDEANIIFQGGLDKKANGPDETFASGREFNIDLTIKNNKGIDSIELNLLQDPCITPVSVEAAEGLTATLEGSKLTITGDNYTGEALANITYMMDEKAVQDFTYSYGADTTNYKMEGNTPDAIITNGSSVLYNFTVGDVNDDGNFNLSDVSNLLKFVAKWDMTSTGFFKDSCDVNADGRVNNMDASYYLKWIAKWPYDFTINGITWYPTNK